MWGLFNSLGKTKRTCKDLPKEARLLLTMIGLFYVGAISVSGLEGRRG